MAEAKSTKLFERFASKATQVTGSSGAFLIALTTVIIWVITGPLFDYSDTWQLVINTSTTIITFLMVFLIQKSQNKDSLAMQIKLNELLAVNRKASNRLLNVEDLSEDELRALHDFFGKLADKAKTESNLSISHSIEEAEEIHEEKMEDLEERHLTQKKKKQASASKKTDNNRAESTGADKRQSGKSVKTG